MLIFRSLEAGYLISFNDLEEIITFASEWGAFQAEIKPNEPDPGNAGGGNSFDDRLIAICLIIKKLR